MTIPVAAEDPSLGSDAQNGTPSKKKSKKISRLDNTEVVDDEADNETGVSSLSKSTKKKKKKKISRNGDSNSPPMLDGFDDDKSGSALGNRTIVSTTSTKKSKDPKKKKKKITEPDAAVEAESADVVSVASKQKTPKKKKKKISRVAESSDVTPENSSRSVADSRTSSKLSKSTKSPKSKAKKKKKEGVNGSEETYPDIERSQSLDLVNQSSNGATKSKMTMEPGQPPEFSVIRRTMSLDTANAQYRPGQRMHGGRMNSNWSGRGRGPGGRGRGPPPITGRGRGRGRGGPPGGWQSRSLRPQDRMQNADMRSSSHERLPYGKRNPSLRSLSQDKSQHSTRDRSHHSYGRPLYGGSSHERSQYGSPRGTNGMARGRRPMSPHKSNGSPTTSSNSHTNMYRAPGRPASILRNSSHGMSRSSHHKSIGTASSHSSSHNRRVNIDLNASSRHSTRSELSRSRKYDQEVDSSDIESDVGDDSSFALDESERFERTREQSRREQSRREQSRRGLSRSLSGLGTNSSHGGLSHFKSQGQSMRSLLTIEQEEFKGENAFIRALRYIHFLAPHPNEDPIKKKIRLVTWGALFCDFMNSLGKQKRSRCFKNRSSCAIQLLCSFLSYKIKSQFFIFFRTL